MGEPLIGIIGIVLGTVLGFILSEISSRMRERRIERREKRAEDRRIHNIRTMLRLEIDHNIARLREFYETVTRGELKDNQIDNQRSCARKVIELPFPVWGHKIWESHLGEAPAALDEQEILKNIDLHNRLDSISDIRSKLLALEAQDKEDVRAGLGASGIEGMPRPIGLSNFDEKAPELWIAWETAVLRDVFDKGNPIKE